jgi:hypothetical protein
MNKTTKTVGAGIATVATIALTATSASANGTLIKVGKYGALSATHNVAYIKLKLTCSPDTTFAQVDFDLHQVTAGGPQDQHVDVSLTNSIECTGNEEAVWISVRRPTGGFKWVKGAARVSDVDFYTDAPEPTHSHLDGRTVYLR